MSDNNLTIERYMEGFRRGDHAMILSCLTDDVEWVIPGMFHAKGKAAFDKEIENDAFVGRPVITITRTIEESNTVVAEGTVLATRRSGGDLRLVFCDVFIMQQAKVRKLISYLMDAGNPPTP
jgi:ketosteroid isomerase-like protein